MNRAILLCIVVAAGLACSFTMGASGSAVAAPITTATCDNADALQILKLLPARGQQPMGDDILRSRITACRKKISKTLSDLPTPPPDDPWFATPSPNESCTSQEGINEAQLYSILTDCVAYLKELSGPSASPLPFLARRPTFYVFSTGIVDQTTNAMIVRSIVDRLSKTLALPSKADDWEVIGRGDWTSVASFDSQCQLDPQTQGAIVVEADYPQPYSNSFLILVNNGTRIDANVEVLGCGPEDHNSSASPLNLWSAKDVDGRGRQLVAPLNILASTVALFAQSRSTNTTTTLQTGPTPISSAAPGTTIQTTTTSTQANLSPLLIASTVAGSLSSQTVPSSNPSGQLSEAAWELTNRLMTQLSGGCGDAVVVEIQRVIQTGTYTKDPYGADFYRGAYQFGRYCKRFNGFRTLPGR
ncbi:MAG TPA: hypothetical protein VFO29_01660 [Candidatus Rubrimentiphilum sp.]|nr:hypothetical protein [Candidatus Rubrimentiphilum sp.]